MLNSEPNHEPRDFAVVVIEASADGLDAVVELLTAASPDSGVAFVVLARRGRGRETALLEALAERGGLPVRQAGEGMPLAPNRVHVVLEDMGLTLRGGAFRSPPSAAQDSLSPPFDALLHAIAEDCGARAACVILGGGGAADSPGRAAIREAGGQVILGGPGGVAGGAVDIVLPVAEIAAALTRRAGRRASGAAGPQDATDALPSETESRPAAAARAGPARPGAALSRVDALGDLCRRLVVENYAPAAALVDSRLACLYTLGPTDRYLTVAPGPTSTDLLAMARTEIRARLRNALDLCREAKARVVVDGGEPIREGEPAGVSIAVEPVVWDGEPLLFVCFLAAPKAERAPDGSAPPDEDRGPAELRRELEATRAALERANQERQAMREAALSMEAQYRARNQELSTSMEVLESRNAELTALNGRLRETLERQRSNADDLQNLLESTDVATLFLDAALNIRFFTPATKALFHVIPSDLGRPLSDLRTLASDDALLDDARKVLRDSAPVEREIAGADGAHFLRRISRYRSRDEEGEGVVITFADITERVRAAEALAAAHRAAERASAAKSRFLAAASHDLRQPMQTLALLQGLLAKKVKGEQAQKLLAQIDETIGAMSGMLNTLLDVNQIEAGAVHAEMLKFSIAEILERLRDAFAYQAQAQGVVLRVVRCGAVVRSDPRLLEQMIRNLLANTVRQAGRGKMLLGCRRRGERLSIEIWADGGLMAGAALQAVLDDEGPPGEPARDPVHELGLSVVRRLSKLLAHPVRFRPQTGRGPAFAIEVGAAAEPPAPAEAPARPTGEEGVAEATRAGIVLVVEDDSEMRALLELLLKGQGYRVETAPDGVAALAMVERADVRPDLVLVDYDLPGGVDGLHVATRIRALSHKRIPVIVLTGDVSLETLRAIARQDCAHLDKPVKASDLDKAVARLLAGAPGLQEARPPQAEAAQGASPVIFVVDDDSRIREGVRALLEDEGRIVEDFPTGEAFLEAWRPGRESCLLIDAGLPGMSGLDLLKRLREAGDGPPAIMITGNSDVPMAVAAMKAGALDFIEKPIGAPELLASVERALERARDSGSMAAWRENAAAQLSELTAREREIMDLVVAGHPSKNIAADLGISQRTVENHRAAIMKKTGSTSLPALARLALAAAWKRAGPPG